MLNDEQIIEQLKKAGIDLAALTAPKPQVETAIDKAIPLPVGAKTITGWIGTVLSGAALALGSTAAVPDLSNWKAIAVSVGVMVLSALLTGFGGIAKWQRQVNASEQALIILTEIAHRLNEQAAAQPVNIREG